MTDLADWSSFTIFISGVISIIPQALISTHLMSVSY